MFDGIVAQRHPCDHCGKTRMVALISRGEDDEPYGVARSEDPLRLCAACIYRLTRLAQLLTRLEAPPKRKAKPPKATRKPRTSEPEAIPPYQGPPKHAVGSLVPQDG